MHIRVTNMMHPHTEVQFISDEVGRGVVATAFIPKGTITWAQDPLDRVFTPAEVAALPPFAQDQLEYFAFKNARGEMVLCWDHARYVNHSFRSNCLSTVFDFEVAVRRFGIAKSRKPSASSASATSRSPRTSRTKCGTSSAHRSRRSEASGSCTIGPDQSGR